ncbi:DUF5320 domain-containing protein [bacterium]|nr:DUF5320 domain-containing protein [bacterium]
MPGGNQTGPLGMGPRTGRGAGYCAGYGMPGYANPAFGGGYYGNWGGRGRGNRNWYYATGLTGWQRGQQGWGVYGAGVPATMPYPVSYDPAMESTSLKSRADALKHELEQIEKRLEDLKGGEE